MISYEQILFDLKPFAIHPKIEKICNDLQSLLNESNPEQKLEMATILRSQLLKIEDDESFNVLNRPELMKIVLCALDLLSKNYPINLTDPISFEQIEDLPRSEVVHLSSGYHFHVRSLVEYFNHYRQDIFTFKNPATTVPISFRDGLRIHRIAEQKDLQFTSGMTNRNILENTMFFSDLLTYLYNLSPQQLGRVMQACSGVYHVYHEIKCSLLALGLCYGLQYILEFYFSNLNVNPQVENKGVAGHSASFMLFNGLPSFFILSVLLFLKRKQMPVMEYNFSQINYFYYLFLAHAWMELGFALQNHTEQIPLFYEKQFCFRYLLVWCITAQLVFPRKIDELQMHYENLLSGVFSLSFEIYRHPQLDAHELRDFFVSHSFVKQMFIAPKSILGIGLFYFLYQQIWNEQSKFYFNLNFLRRVYENGVERAPNFDWAPPAP